MEGSVYEASRRRINDDRTRDLAANEFGRFVSQQRANRGMSDLQRSFGRAMPKFGASFGQRGMAGPGARSGVFQNALQRFVGDHTRTMGFARQDLTNEMSQFDMQGATIQGAHQRALAELEMQRQAEIANAAMQLNALRPYIGG
jgi:hypothetical protein